MEQSWSSKAQRFCRQYLQLEPNLDYPEGTLLRTADVQEAIFSSIFEDGAIQYGPPARYQVKTLKELVSRIEASIDDWDQHVSSTDHAYVEKPRFLVCLTSR